MDLVLAIPGYEPFMNTYFGPAPSFYFDLQSKSSDFPALSQKSGFRHTGIGLETDPSLLTYLF